MEIEVVSRLQGKKREQWESFLQRMGLHPDEQLQETVLVWEEEELIATGSRQENLLKCIAVDPAHRGEDLTATVLTQLRMQAFGQGHRHLFLYTKPKNKALFSGLFFYPVAQTEDVLLMENRRDGIRNFLKELPAGQKGQRVGAAVMNCNPFTLGHRYLVETAAKECDWVYVFVLSEDKSRFSSADRMEMVKRGTADLKNVTVLPTGPYLISSATFPTYFLKDREQAGLVQCQLDIQIFLGHYVPYFGITHRYVGTEPLSPMTRQYNEALHQIENHGIILRELPRLEKEEEPVSASAVRKLMEQDDRAQLQKLVPETTWQYLQEKNLL